MKPHFFCVRHQTAISPSVSVVEPMKISFGILGHQLFLYSYGQAQSESYILYSVTVVSEVTCVLSDT